MALSSKASPDSHPADRISPLAPSSAGRIYRLARFALAGARSPDGRSFLGGIAAGLCSLCLIHQTIARFGSGRSTLVGVAAAATLAVGAGVLLGRVRLSRLAAIVLSILPAIWVLLLAPLSELAAVVCRFLFAGNLPEPAAQFAAAFGVAFLLLGVPAACGSWLLAGDSEVRGRSVLAGAAAAILLAVYLFVPSFEIAAAGWAALATVAAAHLLAAQRGAGPDVSAPAVQLQKARAVVDGLLHVLSAAAAGLMAAALVRATFQLFPLTEAGRWTAFAGFLAGAAGGCGWTWLPPAARRKGQALFLLVGAACSLLPFVAYPLLLEHSLVTTSNVSQVGLLLLLRGLVVFLVLVPVGAIWSVASSISVTGRGPAADNRAHFLLPLSCVALIAVAASSWVFSGGWSVAGVVSVCGACFAVLGGAVLLPQMNGRRTRLAAAAAVAVTLLLTATPQLFRLYDPALASRLLFSTNVFLASHNGMESRLLPFLNDGRLIAVKEGERGVYTLWKHHGAQLQLREDGVPRGAFGVEPEICPLFSGECLPTILPLVLHAAPRRILVLGLGSGTAVSTSLQFPVETVRCWEADRGLTDLIEQAVWTAASVNPRNDSRVTIAPIDPLWGVFRPAGEFDVIVSDGQQAGVASGVPYFTREFYHGVARQLAADGIFSQRFQQIDFGPWPLQSVLATLRSAFSDVAAVEGGPGELVLLATNSPLGLSRPGLLERFQAPQAIRTLAQLGWDWSVALNLAAYSKDRLADILPAAQPLNTTSNGLFAFRLPQETMRWGEKTAEVAAALAPHAGRMAQWAHVEANNPDLLRRLSDVVTEHQLMTSSPDQPWAYRQAVRDDLKKHPHSIISDSPEGFDRVLHPIDRRRLDYFIALGKATQAPRLTPELLHRIEEFARPYDPVLTYFLHHELAFLYARAAEPDPAARLDHRLYTVYYSDTRDRSIRDVEDAIQLLVQARDPMEPADRFDHLNAMLDFLKVRWANRGLVKPPSARILLNDLQRSIAATDAAFSRMEKLANQIGLPPGDWPARREVLERTLVRPLRTYRSELGPYYAKEIEQTAESAAKPGGSPKAN